MLGSAIIVPLLFITGGMRGTRFSGFVLEIMFIIFMVWTVINANTSRKTVIDRREDQQPDEKPLSVPKSIIYAVGGLAVVIGGGQLAVYCAKT